MLSNLLKAPAWQGVFVTAWVPAITMAPAGGLHYAAYKLSPPPVMDGQKDLTLTPDEHAELLAAEPP